MLMLTGTVLYERLTRALLLAAGARSRWVAAGATRVHVIDIPGAGPLGPVVLVHGFSASGSAQYRALVRRLKPHVSRILLPDLPGHGMSDAPPRFVSADLVEALGRVLVDLLDRPAVMFASSLSGPIAVRCATRWSERLSGLMLCSPGGAPSDRARLDQLLDGFRVRDHQQALGFVDRLFPRRPILRQAYAWGVRQQFNRPAMLALLSHIGVDDLLRPQELSSLAVPVSVVWGRQDRILPREHLEFFRQHLPPGAAIEQPHAFGHAPFLHHAPAVAELLLNFARRCDGGRPPAPRCR